MKRTPTWQIFNAILLVLLGLLAIWGTMPSMSAPSQQGATATPTIYSQLRATLVASNGSNDDGFGYSVGISGETVVVGAAYDDHSGFTDAGSAYVYVRSGAVWVEQAQLIAADPSSGDWFGSSAAISGDTIVIGAYKDDDGGNASGSAYVFVRSGTTWTQQAKLTSPPVSASATFGNSVSIDGDTIVVGAANENGVSQSDGAVYVFVRNGTIWTQQQRLTVSEVAAQVGYSVDIYGDTLVAGAPFGNATFVFRRSGTTWTQQQKLSIVPSYTSFGTSVALYEDMMIVGAPATPGGLNQVYVYSWNGTTWELEGHGGPSLPDGYGWSVDIYHNVGLVGHFRASATSTLMAVGAAHNIVVNDDGSLTTLNTFRTENPVLNDVFGFAVARDGWTIVITSPNRDYSGLTNGGAVFVYEVNGPPWRTVTPTATYTVTPNNVTITENEFFAALDAVLDSYPDILTIVPDFVSGAINMSISTSRGTVGNVTVTVTQAQGFVVFNITSITVNGAPAPASYITIINRDLPAILTTALDNVLSARFGGTVDVYGITLTNDGMLVNTLP